MIFNEPLTIFSIALLAAYILAGFFATRNASPGAKGVRELGVYIGAVGVWQAIQIIITQIWLKGAEYPATPVITGWGAAVLSLFFMRLTTAFVARRKGLTAIQLAAGAWLALILAAIFFPTLIPDSSGLPGWSDGRVRLVQLNVRAVWLALNGVSAYLALRAYAQTPQPLIKNRLIYWLIILLFFAGADILFFTDEILAGGLLRFGSVFAAAYVIRSHHMADLNELGLRAARFGLTLFFSGFAYLLLFHWLYPLLAARQVENWLASLILAAPLLLVINPLLAVLRGVIDRLLFGAGYDAANIVRDYSLGISRQLDLSLLADDAVAQITRALQIKNGMLLLVDEAVEHGNAGFHLRAAHGEGCDVGWLAAHGVVAQYFQNHSLPLTQYDIEYNPQFRATPASELAWLQSLDADIFFPIRANGLWVGLFALGPKISGDRYFDTDIALLSALADQTVIALQNGRLYTDLSKLNANLQKTLKELEAANTELRALDTVKSNFISVVSHELRTPFANMSFSQQLFEMYGMDKLTADQREQWRQLTGGIRYTSRLIEDLVTLASFLTGQITLQNEPLNLREILRDTLLPLKNLADGRSQQFSVRILGDLPHLHGDRKLLSSAIHHLVHNAVKFTGEGGSVQISCWSTPEAVCFNVKDTGAGIPKDRLESIWENFSQMADPLKRGVEGLGLGLSLTKHVIHAHHGKIWVESTPGQGSEFGFEIPVAGGRAFIPTSGAAQAG